MTYQVRNVGNSLSITIPPFVAETLKLKVHDKIDIQLEKNYFIVKKKKE